MHGDVQGSKPAPTFWQKLFGGFDERSVTRWEDWKALEGMN